MTRKMRKKNSKIILQNALKWWGIALRTEQKRKRPKDEKEDIPAERNYIKWQKWLKTRSNLIKTVTFNVFGFFFFVFLTLKTHKLPTKEQMTKQRIETIFKKNF